MKINTKSHLILHFDINKTIIMSDPVANISIDKMLNSLLSECIYGTVSKKDRYTRNNDINQINDSKHDSIFDTKYCVDDWTIFSPNPCSTPPHINAVTFGMYICTYICRMHINLI
jgi:hypothetical protein